MDMVSHLYGVLSLNMLCLIVCTGENEKKIHQKELELDKIRNNIFHPFCLLEYDAFCTYYTQHSVSLHNCTMHYRVLNAKLFCFSTNVALCVHRSTAKTTLLK